MSSSFWLLISLIHFISLTISIIIRINNKSPTVALNYLCGLISFLLFFFFCLPESSQRTVSMILVISTLPRISGRKIIFIFFLFLLLPFWPYHINLPTYLPSSTTFADCQFTSNHLFYIPISSEQVNIEFIICNIFPLTQYSVYKLP